MHMWSMSEAPVSPVTSDLQEKSILLLQYTERILIQVYTVNHNLKIPLDIKLKESTNRN